MVNSISNLVNNLAKERFHKIKCNYGDDNENVKFAELNMKIPSVVLNIQTLKII